MGLNDGFDGPAYIPDLVDLLTKWGVPNAHNVRMLHVEHSVAEVEWTDGTVKLYANTGKHQEQASG